MKKVILYVGGFGLPSRTASAQRALENANLFQSIGYTPIIMGKIELPENNESKELTHQCDIKGIQCYDIRHPDANSKCPTYVYHIDSIKRVIAFIGLKNIYAIVAYNYPSVALYKLIKLAKKTNIKMVAECTEWYGIEGKNIYRNIQRFWQTELRMRYLAKKSGNIILASHYLVSYYKKCNTIVLPFVVDGKDKKWHQPPGSSRNNIRKFIYAGSPGIGLFKDSVDTVVKAFLQVKTKGHQFEFIIIGLTKLQFLESVPMFSTVLEELGDCVLFLGRISHEKVLRYMCSSDYMIFLRPKNRMSNVGFPTKLVEAFSCGIPTIINDTSDISRYVVTDRNGFLIEKQCEIELCTTIIRAITINDSKLAAMKVECKENNPFEYENYKLGMSKFLALPR